MSQACSTSILSMIVNFKISNDVFKNKCLPHIYNMFNHFSNTMHQITMARDKNVEKKKVYWSTIQKLCYMFFFFFSSSPDESTSVIHIILSRQALTQRFGIMIAVLLWNIVVTNIPHDNGTEPPTVWESLREIFPGKIVGITSQSNRITCTAIHYTVHTQHAPKKKRCHLHGSRREREGESKSLENSFDTRTCVYLWMARFKPHW